MKRKLLCLLLVFALLLPAGCNKQEDSAEEDAVSASEPSDTAQLEETAPAPRYDATGKYLLSDSGEAVVMDDALRTDFVCQDNYRVFYEIFTGSFSDSDGDGVGDLRGVINRLDYLNDGDPNSGLSLGVEGIWLTPVFTSPSYHKYDVQDYYSVDPQFGTMDDLRELVRLCHERNVKVILDLPINHTSRRNAWFSSFVNAHRQQDPGDPYYDYYSYYSEGQPKPAGRIFTSVSGTDDYYECNFSQDMPELNFDSEAVRQELLDVAAFYLDLGVDGFRFDAAKYVYLGDHEKSVAFWNWYMGELRAINPEVYVVAEVWDADGVTDLYYPAMNCFNFTTSQAGGLIAETANRGNVNRYTAYVESYLAQIGSLRSDAMIVPFIANHDTDRAAGYLQASNGTMQVAANLYLLSSGSPFIYYGEELGMTGSRGGANTDANRRLAMVWGDGDTVKDPEGTTYAQSARLQAGAVEQMGDGGSLYSYYKQVLAIRRANPEIARGAYTALQFEDTKLGGFTASWQGSTVCVIHNTTTKEITVDLSSVTAQQFDTVSACIGLSDASLDGTMLTVGPQTSVVLREAGESTPASAYRFADKEEAAELLLAEREYYEGLNQNDLNYRLQKLDATLEELEAFVKTQTLDFTEEEKAVIDEEMAWFLAECDARGYHLPVLRNVVFAKTTMREESDAGAYTHGTYVFFGEVILSYGTSEEQYYRDYFRSIFVHELFHCLTRNNPDFRRDMYALLGFTVVNEDFVFAPEIANVIIANPDVEHHNSYAAFEIGGKLIDCTVIFTAKPFEQPGDSFFDDMRTCLVPIDDTSVMYDSEDAANFWDVFGRNTSYVIDPEETLADNFSCTVVTGPNGDWPTPELIESIDAYLKGR